jgi:colanic acid/amylovoran biosynthesis glycosyltransferase
LGEITKRLRIGLVLSAVPGYSETFFRNKIKFLQEEGFKVILFADNGQRGFDLCPIVEGFSSQGTKIQRLTKLSALVFRCSCYPFKLLKLWKANKQDGFILKQNLLSLLSSAHILGYSLDWLHFGFATMAVNRENVARIIGAKMAVSIRGFDVCIFPLKHPNIYDLLWKRLDKLHYISDDLLKVAIELGFNETTKSQKITPAIDVTLFKKEECQSVKGQESIITIVTIARLHWKKGLDYTLDALKIVKDAGILFEYQIMGDGPEYERLMFERHQLGLDNEVVFTGKLSPEKIKEKLAVADLYIQYSTQEGFCNSVLEAQTMGCFCVVSDAEGLSENVLNGITGVVIEKRNPKLLSETILNVFRMSIEDKQRIRKQAMERVTKEFNLDVQKQQFIEFYNF